VLTTGALALGVLLAACGGGPPAGSSAGAGGGTHTGTGGLLAYSSCMRSHGVPNFPDPGGKGAIPKQAVISALRSVSTSQARAASDACSHLLPPGGSLSGRPEPTITTQDQQDYLNAAACMRSHGITDFPDPTFSGGHVSVDIPSSVDTHSAQFTQAQHTCEKLIPAGLPYSGATG
jgi:hypothetical protein